MNRTYQYRLYPTRQQKAILFDILNRARWLYNHALAYRRKKWQESRQHVTYYEQAAMWKQWRNEEPADNPLRLLNMTAGQQILRRLDKTFQNFYRRKQRGEQGGFPRFKGKNRFHSLEYRHGDGCKLFEDSAGRMMFYVQNVGNIKVKFHRALPHGCMIKHVVITHRNGRWYINLQLELTGAYCPQRPIDNAVGIDAGLSSLLATHDGQLLDNPRWLRSSLKKLSIAQRTVARRKKGSQRRRKAVRQVARLHEHIANQRRDFWHKVTTDLTSCYSLIAIEDLNLDFMIENHHLSLSASDAALGMFFQFLGSKAEEAGCRVVEVNRFRTSQRCSGCGEIVRKDLSVRVHHCPYCQLELDRDVNAARNILKLALAPLGRSGQDLTWRDSASVS